MNVRKSKNFYYLYRNFFRFCDLLSYFDSVHLPGKDEEVSNVVGVMEGYMRRYDDTYLVYSYEYRNCDYLVFFSTPWDETHRAYSRDRSVEWYDAFLPNTEVEIEVSVKNPGNHRVLGGFERINRQWRYFFAVDGREDFARAAKLFVEKQYAAAYDFGEVMGSYSKLQETASKYGLDIPHNVDFSSEKCLLMLRDIGDEFQKHELIVEEVPQKRYKHPLYIAAYALSSNAGRMKDLLDNMRSLSDLEM